MKLQKLLTHGEHERLAALEKTIEKGRKTWIEAGKALIEIRDSELYRQTHKTFADYCQDRWGWDRRRAYQLIEGIEVIESLPENVNHGSQINERQARELSKVEPAKREEVIEKAQAAAAEEEKPLTARHIAEAAEQLQEEDSPTPPREPESFDDSTRQIVFNADVETRFKKFLDHWPADELTFVRQAIRAYLRRSQEHDEEAVHQSALNP